MSETATIYLTREQLQRLAGISCDALVGIQIHTDANDETDASFEYVPVDHPTELNYGRVRADGSWEDET
jgi:hypothetical protein